MKTVKIKIAILTIFVLIGAVFSCDFSNDGYGTLSISFPQYRNGGDARYPDSTLQDYQDYINSLTYRIKCKNGEEEIIKEYASSDKIAIPLKAGVWEVIIDIRKGADGPIVCTLKKPFVAIEAGKTKNLKEKVGFGEDYEGDYWIDDSNTELYFFVIKEPYRISILPRFKNYNATLSVLLPKNTDLNDLKFDVIHAGAKYSIDDTRNATDSSNDIRLIITALNGDNKPYLVKITNEYLKDRKVRNGKEYWPTSHFYDTIDGGIPKPNVNDGNIISFYFDDDYLDTTPFSPDGGPFYILDLEIEDVKESYYNEVQKYIKRKITDENFYLGPQNILTIKDGVQVSYVTFTNNYSIYFLTAYYTLDKKLTIQVYRVYANYGPWFRGEKNDFE